MSQDAAEVGSAAEVPADRETAPQGTRKPKNIVLCSDGTGNRGGKGHGTNVWRLYQAVDLQCHRRDPQAPEQITFYDDGVGTETYKIFKTLGGAFGWGLSRNIRELYEFLAKTYQTGDRIYLFGFSRGAFTVRSLAGLICKCGLIDNKKYADSQALKKGVAAAFTAYRDARKQKNDKIAADFKKDHGRPDVTIEFIGVWDTVDAIGVPMDGLRYLLDKIFRISFHNCDLHEDVKFGCHALAIDDERATFSPVMWNEKGRGGPNGTIEQVWFAGAHSNVGGGYPKQGMAQVALDWMMTRASSHDLVFESGALDRVRQDSNVHDKLYDPRSGLAAYYRYRPRNIAELWSADGEGPARIHASVFQRIDRASGDYAPGNLPETFEIAETGTGNPPPRLDQGTSEALQHHLAEHWAAHGGLLRKTKPWIRARKALHLAFVLFTLGILGGALYFLLQPVAAPANGSKVVEFGGGALAYLVPGFLESLVKSALPYFQLHPIRALAALGVIVILFVFRSTLRKLTTGTFAAYWDRARPLIANR
jgi:uncharacterized protein (DUF2235 family)